MRWFLVRPGIIRLTYDNGAFVAEFGYEGRKLLTAVNRGGTAVFDLEQIESEARQLVAKGITSATANHTS